MNIFVLDRDTQLCARQHMDRHVVKMPLESAQMLCTAITFHGGNPPYRTVHKNHPCSVWARQTQKNFMWLLELGLELCHEYKFRYGKVHGSFRVINYCFRKAEIVPYGELTPFAQAMPDEYKRKDPVDAYRVYYKEAKIKLASWKDRDNPEWWNEHGTTKSGHRVLSKKVFQKIK